MVRKKQMFTLLILGILFVFVAVSGCTSPGKRTGIGAGAGAATGAAIGGATGGWKGAGIGAAAGAVAGGAIGNYLDKQAKELKEVADTKRTRDGILVNLKNDLLFDSGRSELKSIAVQQITELASILAKYPEDRIRVAGYTDDVGSSDFNKELAEARASAVSGVLKDNGVKDDQIRAQGIGEMNPIAPNSTVQGRAKNRRVELFIDVPQDKSSRQTSNE